MIRKLRVVEVLCEDEEHCSKECQFYHRRADVCCLEDPLWREALPGWETNPERTESCKREAIVSNGTAEVFIRYIGVSATAMHQAERIEQLERELAEERARRC